MNEYLEWMSSDEYQEIAHAQEKFFAEHWANDLLHAPHALISVIETKIARAELRERERIVKLIEQYTFRWDEKGTNFIFLDKNKLMEEINEQV